MAKFKIGDKVDVADSVFWNYTTGAVITDVIQLGRDVSYLFKIGNSAKYYQEEKYFRKTGDDECYCESCEERRNNA